MTNSKSSRPERRAEIISAAATLFDRDGYHQTTMDDIAAAIGLRKPTLYHHVSGKDEILFYIHEEFIDLAGDRLLARAGAPLSPEQQLLEVMVDILELIDSHSAHVRVFFDNYRELSQSDNVVLTQKRDAYFGAVEQIIRDGVAGGRFRNVDTKLTALALFGACNWAYRWLQHDAKLRPREIAYEFWGVFLYGLVTAGPSAP